MVPYLDDNCVRDLVKLGLRSEEETAGEKEYSVLATITKIPGRAGSRSGKAESGDDGASAASS